MYIKQGKERGEGKKFRYIWISDVFFLSVGKLLLCWQVAKTSQCPVIGKPDGSVFSIFFKGSQEYCWGACARMSLFYVCQCLAPLHLVMSDLLCFTLFIRISHVPSPHDAMHSTPLFLDPSMKQAVVNVRSTLLLKYLANTRKGIHQVLSLIFYFWKE